MNLIFSKMDKEVDKLMDSRRDEDVAKIPTRSVSLDLDVAKYFPTEAAVNEALRFLIRINRSNDSESSSK